MNSLSSVQICGLVFQVAVASIITYSLLKQIFVANCHGKLIFKLNERKNLALFLVLVSIAWFFLLITYVRVNMHYKGLFNISSILGWIGWIELSILGIISAERYSEIRENGIYLYLGFYKWDRVVEYNWISLSTIQFKVNVFFKINRSFKLEVPLDEKTKVQIDEVLHRYIHS